VRNLTSLRRFGAIAAAMIVATTTLTATANAAVDGKPRPIPPHVFAPYFQAYLPGDPADFGTQSGALFQNLAFLETDKPGSCQVYPNGVANGPDYADAAAKLSAAGGQLIPSFGGAYAGDNGIEIADSCADVHAIALAYEQALVKYKATQLDMDIEDASLTNAAGIDRRNKALLETENWAAAQGRPLKVVYTMGTGPTAPNGDAVKMLQNAVANGTRVDVVNIMAFDYYDNKQHEMAADAKSAAAALVTTLHGLWPSKTPSQLWGMVGVTAMIGLDDYGSGGETGPVEEFTPADAVDVTVWAWQHGIALLSFWGLHRDNGSCPGQHLEPCSGVRQAQWEYSTIMGTFTHR
jgi:Glycosyl hydrolases family 18